MLMGVASHGAAGGRIEPQRESALWEAIECAVFLAPSCSLLPWRVS
jgi:hypothetical protein